MKIKKAIVPAAGYGTRFLPFTKAVAKEMIPIINKPVIDYVVSEITNTSIDEILIITSSHKNTLLRYFDTNPDLERTLKVRKKEKLLELTLKTTADLKVHFCFQYEQKGLGHAILNAEQFVNNEPFAVLLGDDIVFNKVPALKQCLDVYNAINMPVIGVQKVAPENLNKYGVLKLKSSAKSLPKNASLIDKLVEKPTDLTNLSDLAILGRYILVPEIFAYLKKTLPGAGNEIQITDALNAYAKDHELAACEFSGLRFDIGSPAGMLEANIYLALQSPDFRDIVINTFNRFYQK